MNSARSELHKAGLRQLGPGNKVLLESAREYFDSALSAWSLENKRIVFFRNFDSAIKYAERSMEFSRMAVEGSRNYGKFLDIEIARLRNDFTSMDKEFSSIYSRLPLIENQRKNITQARMLFSRAEFAALNDRQELSYSCLLEANELIKKVNSVCESILKEYFREFDRWEHSVDQILKESSRQKSSILVVDKYAHTCFLYRSGHMAGSFPVEFGANWIGDKQVQGDKATPEGIYSITGKKEGGGTKFHKALLINYPNEDDRKRFLFNKRNGSIPEDANPGNLIEIHGHGGKGTDWTDGCIALINSDMDKIYGQVGVGTKLLIVGSMRSLDEIYAD